MTGLLLAAAGLTTLPTAAGLGQLVLGRMLTGAGQGLVFIGVQSFILGNAGADRRTRGASIIVVGFQGGMLSGMAIGSLLVRSLGLKCLYIMGTSTALLLASLPPCSANGRCCVRALSNESSHRPWFLGVVQRQEQQVWQRHGRVNHAHTEPTELSLARDERTTPAATHTHTHTP